MRILLYTEFYKILKKSGIGKAIEHQIQALSENNIEYTLDLKSDYDIVHINHYGLKSYFIAKKAKKSNKKIVYHAHSTQEDFKNSFIFSNTIAPLFKKWIIKCYSMGDIIITPSEYSKKTLESYNINKKIVAISNGVDTDFFKKDIAGGKEFREKYGLKPNDVVIMSVGVYMQRKGILDFVEMAKRMPQYKFIWFGESPLYLIPKVIKKAVKTKLDNLYFAGYVEPTELKKAYSGSNLFFYPTFEETEGIPIIEALSSKINVLARDIPVFNDYIDKKDIYKFNSLDNAQSLIEKIVNRQVPSLSKTGLKCVKEKDIKIVGKSLASIYRNLI
jgi:1,2-diacylglycerol-3-alpha-glucose alpha-1,2-glucosyltransferase